MKNSDWRTDIIAAGIFILVATICGMVSDYWLACFFGISLIFFIWKYLQFRRFYQWYKAGASKDEIPSSHGIFAVLANQVLENKRQTKKIQRRNQYLIEQFNTTAQALPFATVLLNTENEVQWSNRSAYNLLNIRISDQGQRIDNIIRNPQFIEMLSSSKTDQELRLEHPLDTEKKIHLRLITLSRYRQLLVARDISAQEALQKSRRAFVANASHELRSPLTVISGYLEMIKDSGQVPEDWSIAIDQALEQSNRMEQIIADMLKLATIEHDRYMETKFEPIQMPKLLNRLFNDLKNSRDAAQHHMTAQIDSELMISGNESEITSVCLNLMRNAVIHTSPGTSVHIHWFKDDNSRPNLWVRDNGEGIDNKHMPHLTERFYRVDNSRTKNVQSTGLGLAIVKHICLKHQAEFEIESQKGKGSVFKVKFKKV